MDKYSISQFTSYMVYDLVFWVIQIILFSFTSNDQLNQKLAGTIQVTKTDTDIKEERLFILWELVFQWYFALD